MDLSDMVEVYRDGEVILTASMTVVKKAIADGTILDTDSYLTAGMTVPTLIKGSPLDLGKRREVEGSTHVTGDQIVYCYRQGQLIISCTLDVAIESIRKGTILPSDTFSLPGVHRSIAAHELIKSAAETTENYHAGKKCPHCGSKRIQRSRAIYEGGTTTSSTEGYSQRAVGGATAFKSARTYRSTNVRQTKLAEKHTPPSGSWKGCLNMFLFLFAFGGVVGAGREGGPGAFLVLLMMFGLLTWAYMSTDWYKDGAKDEENANATYELTWYCHKCGKTHIDG